MNFDRKRAVQSIVTACRDDSATGMGVVAVGGYLLTAAHRLPRIPIQRTDVGRNVQCEPNTPSTFGSPLLDNDGPFVGIASSAGWTEPSNALRQPYASQWRCLAGISD